MNDREQLLNEANELGLEFPANIPSMKLAVMISEFKGEPAPLDETAPPSPEAKPELSDEADALEAKLESNVKAKTAALSRFAAKRKKIAEAKARASRTEIVTLTNKDNRENDVMTTAYLSFQNQYFGISKRVPLDIPVELEISLIKIAASCTMTLHKDEIVNGKRTGNKIPVRVKKYAISYSKQKPSD